jgi:hypothetical protein
MRARHIIEKGTFHCGILGVCGTLCNMIKKSPFKVLFILQTPKGGIGSALSEKSRYMVTDTEF